MSRTRVLYILGWGRSGSTVLGNILGEIDGFFSAGELHYLWERSLVEGRACGCGRDVPCGRDRRLAITQSDDGRGD